jgi:hypothetical protein
MMINNSDFEERIRICKACPIFNEKYKTCGPPTNAINPFKKPTTLDGITFKPCGCPIDHLASYEVTSCPAKKWPTINQQDWQQPTLEEIRAIRKRGIVQSGEMSHLFKLRKEYLGIKDNKSFTTCTPCMNELLDRLERHLVEDLKKAESAQALIELTNLELTTEPKIKKRRAKRKKL